MTQKYNSKLDPLKNVRTSDSSLMPVSLSDVKNFLKYEETSPEEDALLTGLIKTAWRYAEKRTNRALLSETYVLYLDFLPTEYIQLPIADVTSVTHVKYYDASNTLQTLPTSLYQVDLNRIDPLIYTENFTMPPVYDKRNAVEVTYTAGHATASAVPQLIRHAIMILVAHWFENRTMHQLSPSFKTPTTVDALLGICSRKHF